MRPLFDQRVSKERVGAELNEMLIDKERGFKALSMMTDLGILENYVTLMCSPEAEEVPDYCFLIGKFMEEDKATIIEDSTKEDYMRYELTYNDDEISQWNAQKDFQVKVVG